MTLKIAMMVLNDIFGFLLPRNLATNIGVINANGQLTPKASAIVKVTPSVKRMVRIEFSDCFDKLNNINFIALVNIR